MEPETEPKRFKLRRLKPITVDNDIIQKNLEPLKLNTQRKQFAQELYYENHKEAGMSPLIRESRKQPVHQRLGRKHPLTLGTNTSSILPKRRLRLPSLGSNNLFNKRSRIFSAQQRLNRIRANQREVMASQNSSMPKRIKLRRTLPHFGGATNLMVEVKNNNAFFNRHQAMNGIRRFRQILSPHLQLEIKNIQATHPGHQTIVPFRVTPAATEIALHQRFAQLSGC
ncbi:hypothetical protein NQ315_017098 [Exocentrus adspersus]|uniref:Ribosomal protein S4 n=1 Tax=Exocentrus adspersus TaxID=1586481 RepID=A0AAV8VGX5_9CUCU|nr:hypothetical protein NQ315_017098 [Exocentrus adspersus]